MIGLTRSLAKEVARDRIAVNAFCPDVIETDMWAYNDAAWGKLLGDYRPGELMAEWVRDIPTGRAGPDAAYVAGQAIDVDGGLIMSEVRGTASA